MLLFLFFYFRVTVLKDRDTRKSRGVAFILFLKVEDAVKCVEETNLKEVRELFQSLSGLIAL